MKRSNIAILAMAASAVSLVGISASESRPIKAGAFTPHGQPLDLFDAYTIGSPGRKYWKAIRSVPDKRTPKTVADRERVLKAQLKRNRQLAARDMQRVGGPRAALSMAS